MGAQHQDDKRLSKYICFFISNKQHVIVILRWKSEFIHKGSRIWVTSMYDRCDNLAHCSQDKKKIIVFRLIIASNIIAIHWDATKLQTGPGAVILNWINNTDVSETDSEQARCQWSKEVEEKRRSEQDDVYYFFVPDWVDRRWVKEILLMLSWRLGK